VNPLAGLVAIGAAVALGRIRGLSGSYADHIEKYQETASLFIGVNERLKDAMRDKDCSEAFVQATNASILIGAIAREANWMRGASKEDFLSVPGMEDETAEESIKTAEGLIDIGRYEIGRFKSMCVSSKRKRVGPLNGWQR
jgi:hypothetical protein